MTDAKGDSRDESRPLIGTTSEETSVRLVSGRILHLAWPTFTVLLIQTGVGVAETYYLSRLGIGALAGAALVTPILLLMTTLSNGGIGGGVASAIARALGAKDKQKAEALAWHAMLLAIACGLLLSLIMIGLGPTLFKMLGGTDGGLAAAVTYSNALFATAVFAWVASLLSAVFRGAGEVKAPALLILISAVVIIPLSPLLIFGFGRFSGIGVAGAGIAVGIYYVIATVALAVMLRRRGSVLRLRPSPFRLNLMLDILKVGGVSAVGNVVTSLNILLVTAAVGHFGAVALAGYGIASRLDVLLVTPLFGLGSAVVTLVGRSVGAGDGRSAKQIAWIGAAMGTGLMATIGMAAAIYPNAWLTLFSRDPEVLIAGAQYLRTVGPAYGFVGLGSLLFFASQGAGRPFWPFSASVVRTIIAAGFGLTAVATLKVGTQGLYFLVALSLVIYGGMIALSTHLQSWNAISRKVQDKP